MDVSSIIQEAQQNAAVAHDWRYALALGVLVVGLLCALGAAVSMSRNGKEHVTLGLFGIGAILVVLGGVALPVNIVVSGEEYSTHLNKEIADAASEHYGVNVSPEVVSRAWAGSDDEIVLFTAVEDEGEKSFGLNITEEGKLTVYQGDVAIEPAK